MDEQARRPGSGSGGVRPPGGRQVELDVAHIVCVASAKGGVGKSTTAANLAVALAQAGHATGLLDADIYGPSLPLLMGIAGTRPEVAADADSKCYMLPVPAHGVACNSMGLLVPVTTAMAWRAPMIISAFRQILADTRWGKLDYLIVDLPPGTGDIQLSLSQATQVSGAVIVTTPQELALLDARKGIDMFGKVGIAVLGVVENMSVHVCGACGHAEPIFGSGGGAALARESGVAVIGQLPLDSGIRAAADSGIPVVLSAPASAAAAAYRQVAEAVVARVGTVAAQASGPRITVSDD